MRSERGDAGADGGEAVGAGHRVGPCVGTLADVDEERRAPPRREELLATAGDGCERFGELGHAIVCRVEARRRRSADCEGKQRGCGRSDGDRNHAPRGLEDDEQHGQERRGDCVRAEIREPFGERARDEITAVEELRQRLFVGVKDNQHAALRERVARDRGGDLDS